jgi:hypothetical protein
VLATLAAASGVLHPGPAGAQPSQPCATGQPGFTQSFWDPYDNWSIAQIQQELGFQHQLGDNGLIVDWSVDQEANAAWYPDALGYGYFENSIPNLVSAARSSNVPLWMGLIVSPSLFAANGNSWNFLEGEVPAFERVADDLYRQYGSAIRGWYIPTEPSQANVATYALSYQYGAWLNQIDGYLHTHDGNKQVMIAAQMPSAANSGLTPTQFVQEIQPMMAVAHMDVWNFEDGFGMTGWTPQQEAAGFALAKQYASSAHATVWADVYTPPASTPSQWEPYLRAIAGARISQLTQWTFPVYMDPNVTTFNAQAAADFQSYSTYCAG